MIRAEVHSDDHKVEVNFDATAWFQQASEDEIVSVAACGWQYDYPTDNIAIWYSAANEEVQKLFFYLGIVQDQGFGCWVHANDALAWLAENRPAARRKIAEEVA
jgi:hypothetical protein